MAPHEKRDVFNDTTLLDLNVDCLLEIFKYLNVFDLSAVAEISDDFYWYAQYLFEQHHKRTLNFNHPKIKITNGNDFERVLKCFGQLAKSIVVSMTSFTGMCTGMSILELFAKHCGPNIEQLTLISFFINLKMCTNQAIKSKIYHLMSNVKNLTIHNGTLIHSGLLFEVCHLIVEQIYLRDVLMDNSTRDLFVRNYPSIRSLILLDRNRRGTTYMTDDILERLRSLNICMETFSLIRSSIMKSLVGMVCGRPNLNELLGGDENVDRIPFWAT